jgi:hypothetical protein
VTLPLTAAEGTTRAPGAPVWAKVLADSRGPYAGPAQATVRILDHATAAAAGVDGVLFTVSTPVDAGSGSVRVGVDYIGFADAYGGNYGSRLRLIQLPACALSTPAVASCRIGTPLASKTRRAEA